MLFPHFGSILNYMEHWQMWVFKMLDRTLTGWENWNLNFSKYEYFPIQKKVHVFLNKQIDVFWIGWSCSGDRCGERCGPCWRRALLKSSAQVTSNINPDELDICTSVISSCLHEWHFSGTLDFAKSVYIREIMIIISKLYFIYKLYSEKNVQLYL